MTVSKSAGRRKAAEENLVTEEKEKEAEKPPSPPVDSKFREVLVAAQRAEQIMRGARPKVDAGRRKPTRIAMEELSLNQIEWDYGPAPQPEPEPAPAEEPVEVH